MSSNGNMLVTILPLVILVLVMYFLLIRPQKKREKEVNAMRSNVQVGDEIITIGGICGKVVKTKDESLVIQVGADRIKFEIMRWAVSKVVEESTKRPAKPYEDEELEEEEPKKSKTKSKPRKLKKAAAEAEESPEDEAAKDEAPEEAETEEEKAAEVEEAVETEAEASADDAEAEAEGTDEETETDK